MATLDQVRTRFFRVGSPLLVCIFLIHSLAFAGWKGDYRDALKAMRAAEPQYEHAVQLLKSALAERPDPEDIAVRGFDGYFPYLHLGMCYFALGQMDDAEAALLRAQKHGLLDNHRYWDYRQQVRSTLQQIRDFEVADNAAQSSARSNPLDREPIAECIRLAESGNYVEAAQGIFAEAIFDSRYGPELHVLSGAFYYTAYLLGGETEGDLLRNAEQQFDRGLSRSPDLRISTKHFSPRVVDFFELYKQQRALLASPGSE